MKPKIYFDWCAIQNLLELDDKRLVLKIKDNFFIMISSVNVNEAVSTPTSEQRNKLLKFCGELIKPKGILLDEPINLLKRSYLAFKLNQKSIDCKLKSFNIDFLVNPEKYPYNSKWVNQYRKMEDIYIKMNRGIRSDKMMIETLKDKSITGDQINFLNLIFKSNKFDDLLKSVFSITMKGLGVECFDKNEGPEVIKNLDIWKYCWSALFLGTYHLAIKPENYSPKNNAGFRDLLQIIYALACDYFITDDGDFYDVLKCFINSDFATKRVNVMKLDEFLVLKYKNEIKEH